MARTSIRLTKTPTVQTAGGPNGFNFLNSGNVTDVGTQATALLATIGSVSVGGTLVAADSATVVTNAGTSAGTLGVTTLNTDILALTTLIATASAAAVAMNTAATADVEVSFDTTKITSVTQLRRAFDRAIGLAQGGIGGLTP